MFILPRRIGSRPFFWLALFSLWLTASSRAAAPFVLISLDGFRWDYCDLYPEEAKHLRILRVGGASLRGLIPVFPSNTFPNHYTIATGLRPIHHGIINNRMYDADTKKLFANTVPGAMRDPLWWGGEPVWITAEKQGRVAACYFWPGSEVAIEGRTASLWMPFDYSQPFALRLERISSWFARPVGQRPDLLCLYFEETNGEGHRHGPNSPDVRRAIAKLDQQVGLLLETLRAVVGDLNVMIVSDHGMTPTPIEHTVFLDDILDLKDVQFDGDGPFTAIRPQVPDPDAWVAQNQGRLPSALKFVRSADLPAHYHFAAHPRIPRWYLMADPGWRIERRPAPGAPPKVPTVGEHGYDPRLPDMQGTMIVHGPAFRQDGAILPPAENIHLYEVICAAMQLTPAKNDGDASLARSLLRADGATNTGAAP